MYKTNLSNSEELIFFLTLEYLMYSYLSANIPPNEILLLLNDLATKHFYIIDINIRCAEKIFRWHPIQTKRWFFFSLCYFINIKIHL